MILAMFLLDGKLINIYVCIDFRERKGGRLEMCDSGPTELHTSEPVRDLVFYLICLCKVSVLPGSCSLLLYHSSNFICNM
jgi:hypothetical protein